MSSRACTSAGVLGTPVLAPGGADSPGNSSTAIYAALAAASALLCTGMLHLLLEVPRPITFFIWTTVLADIIVATAPFTQPAPLGSKVFTAVINLVTGVAVISRSCPGWREAIRNERVAGPAPAPRSR